MAEKFTDYVLTLEGPYSQVVWDYLEHEILPGMQKWVGEADIGLASHECNDDGDTYHSLLTRNRILADRVEELLRERTALQVALRKEFNRG